MNIISRQTQLYKFLNYCNCTNLEKSVLDCGAGGNCPPLALFSEFGYNTFGIEFSDLQIEKINFLSVNDFGYGQGEKIGQGYIDYIVQKCKTK